MPSVYRPRKGGSIEVLSDKVVSDVVVDLTKKTDPTVYVEPEEKFINDYMQHNTKRIQSASSSSVTHSSLSNDVNIGEQQQSNDNKPRRSARHASARRLFEVNEWDEQQKRLKHKTQTSQTNSTLSYDEIKTATHELLKDYEQLIDKYDFENNRRREYIYRNYHCNVREPFFFARSKQIEHLDKTRLNRNRFKAHQYKKYLEFINKHELVGLVVLKRIQFITQNNHDKNEYDPMAKYGDTSERIRTALLSDPTLLSYHKFVHERHTMSFVGSRTQTDKIPDPRRVVSEQDFRFYHRTAMPLLNGRTAQSALTWPSHDENNIESPVRRLASAKCHYIEQKSQNPTSFDPTVRNLTHTRHRSASSSITTTTRISTPNSLN